MDRWTLLYCHESAGVGQYASYAVDVGAYLQVSMHGWMDNTSLV